MEKNMERNNSSNSREERRRRIAERGADRMALITGRVQSLNVPPPLSSPSTPVSPPRHIETPVRHFSLSEPTSPKSKSISADNFKAPLEGRVDVSTSTKHESTVAAQEVGFEDRNLVESQIKKSEPMEEVERVSAIHSEVKEKPPTESSMLKTSNDNQLFSRSSRIQPRLFSSKRIISYIAATENIRIFCSCSVAFLVVLSHNTNWLFRIVVALRPLFILLLSDVTFLVSRLYLEKPEGYEEDHNDAGNSQATEIHIDGALRMLERALVVYQTIRAMFIDCSVYSVIVVCGLSLV